MVLPRDQALEGTVFVGPAGEIARSLGGEIVEPGRADYLFLDQAGRAPRRLVVDATASFRNVLHDVRCVTEAALSLLRRWLADERPIALRRPSSRWEASPNAAGPRDLAGAPLGTPAFGAAGVPLSGARTARGSLRRYAATRRAAARLPGGRAGLVLKGTEAQGHTSCPRQRAGGTRGLAWSSTVTNGAHHRRHRRARGRRVRAPS